MENASYVGLSYQVALSRQMDVVANNIANLSTAGYRGEREIFEEVLERATNGRRISFVQDRGIWRDTREGPITHTGRTFDVALNGNGYFVVDTADGQRYTRDGRFQLGQQGQLLTATGDTVLDARNNPIVVDGADGEITIGQDGSINSQLGQIGRFQLVRFADEQQMQKAGDGLYQTQQPAQPANDVRVVQGAVEGSNVQGVVEVTRMMDISRRYQSTARMIEASHDLMRRSIERLGKVASA